ncbi:MAG: Bax inhibitor-1/YccA family protein, partial [Anaerolineae bacterium]|nr:Bax inhibitor-1/YccA family protein [Anaerolineae bacterium]
WMAAGLVVTTAVAFLTINTEMLYSLLMNPAVLIIAMFAQIGLVIALGAAIQKMSPATAAIMFLVYSALTGFTLSLIVFTYTAGTITAAFATTAILFAVMSVVGFTTSADLTKFRTLAMFALIGLLIAMVVNIFLASPMMDMVISFIGVILFIGLLAMDTQRLKIMAAAPEVQTDRNVAARIAILGALNLYLDVINLFLFLLRLLGGSRR